MLTKTLRVTMYVFLKIPPAFSPVNIYIYFVPIRYNILCIEGPIEGMPEGIFHGRARICRGRGAVTYGKGHSHDRSS
jgi:hypothetical protein